MFVTLLAVSDDVRFLLPLFVSIAAIAVTAVLWWGQRQLVQSMAAIAEAVRKYERMEDKSSRDMDAVKKSLHDTSVKLIDERFRAMTHELNTHVQGFTSTLDDMKDKLIAGDGSIDALSERDQKLELTLAQNTNALKDYIREHTASKNDVQRHEATVERKFNEMGKDLNEVGKQVAVLANQVQRNESARKSGN